MEGVGRWVVWLLNATSATTYSLYTTEYGGTVY